jgi:hypothetical protein
MLGRNVRSFFLSPSRTRLLLAISFAVPFFALTLFWACFIRANYFPSRDEFSLLVASTKMFHPAISSWFLEGYSRYFISYPGLSHPATDFIRPGANLAYYLNSVVFGARWSWYLLLTYAIQAGIVCLCAKLAIEALKVPAKLALAMGFAVFLSPSFGWEQVFIPSFTIDLLGAFFVVFALHELWRKRYVSAWLLLAAAVFTKETTLFAPCMAALAVWLPSRKTGSIGRRLVLSLVWLAPILGWALLRRLAFHGDAGIYVLQNMALSGKIANVLHGFLAWPFGTRNAQQSVQLRLLYFPLNGTFWVTCLWSVLRILKRKAAAAREQDSPLSALVLFCVGAFAMPVLLNLPQRFGASVYPLFFLLLATLISSADDRFVRNWAAACLAVAACVSIYQKAVDPLTLRESRAEWALSSNYIQAIHDSKAPYLLMVDDASGGFAAPDLVARFADFHGVLMRSNNIEGLSLHQCAGQPAITKTSNVEKLRLTSIVEPPCGYYAFDSLSTRELEHATDGLTTRPANLTLLTTPPASQPLARSGLQQMFGTLTVEMKNPPPGLVVLVPDLNNLRYEELK